ncbi:MAG: MerR family transcriptional regulator [Acidimicrobiales bacterium]
MTPTELLDIADVVAQTGVSVSTLHLWERRGLVQPAGRSGLRRQYDQAAVGRIATIVAFQRGGFTLAEILELLNVSGDRSKAMLSEKCRQLYERRAQIDLAIEALEHGMVCPEPNPIECTRFQAKAIAMFPAGDT